jgi:hypothetical protein
MSLKAQLPEDSKRIFLNSDEFAEEITYAPKAGSPKTIKAIVVRQRLDSGSEDQGRILRNQAEIYIANDATGGVTSVDKGDDEASFPEIPGGSSVSWVVIDILGTDDGMWHLLLEK